MRSNGRHTQVRTLRPTLSWNIPHQSSTQYSRIADSLRNKQGHARLTSDCNQPSYERSRGIISNRSEPEPEPETTRTENEDSLVRIRIQTAPPQRNQMLNTKRARASSNLTAESGHGKQPRRGGDPNRTRTSRRGNGAIERNKKKEE